MSARILVVDDDPHIREVICFALTKAGMEPAPAHDGAEALRVFDEGAIDLVILDIGLPEMDGLDVCRQIRRRGDTPVLFLSARSDEIDRVVGLELGGDDYVTKPFSPRELVARVAAILKRARPAPVAEGAEGVITSGALVLDGPRFVARYNGVVAPLTALEFAILRLLAGRPGVVFNRARIVAAAYPDNIHVSDRTIDSHIRNLRAKFVAIGCDAIVETVHGVGFRLGDLAAKA